MAWLQIIAACVAVFFLQMALPGLTNSFAFVPANAFSHPWTFVTSLFLHGGITHLFFNMWALFMFGPLLERRIGERKFYALYFISGIVGNLAFVFFYPAHVLGLGASGAIFGVIGALAVLMPSLPLLFFFIPTQLWVAAIFWVAIDLFLTGSADDVAHYVHLAGIAVGVGWGMLLKKQEPPEYYFGQG
jgi:membrane associated rhomboid family serine protease